MLKRIFAVFAALMLMVGLAACSSNPNATQSEQASRDNSYKSLIAEEPAHEMHYSSTRVTINKWIDTWGKPGKISYNYIEYPNGNKLVTLGFYALKGLPVSYCTGLTPPYTWVDIPGDGDRTKQQAPGASVDGAYYSGGDCNRYYGFDAITNQYIEYSVPMNMMVRTTDQPLDNVTAPNLGHKQ